MGENIALLIRAYFVKTVQVELSYKRRIVGVLEMFWKYLLSQLGYILDNKSVLFWDPLNGVRVVGILY